jgi:2-amino-4-hydroxy-6-hydroxymethyldihydropteridine diphosphokinase
VAANAGAATARVFVAIGSSLAPEEHVPGALARLDAAAGVKAVSTFYATPALERPDDPPFVNGVAEVGGALGPAELREELRRIEAAEGRVRLADRYAPRTLDLDLIAYDDLEVQTETLTLPHPHALKRAFVLVPLAEIRPGRKIGGRSVKAALAELSRAGIERLPAPD